ncbi:MAG: hypothetical protein NTW60_02310 [Candidatus Wolfebacteria bacterium]|nr:hypothetical protein [Candidatus Wolfebacteria bacterium]
MLKPFPCSDIKEFKIFRKLNTPIKIQNFLDTIPMNFEKEKETVRSPIMVLRKNEAHCIEAAMLVAAVLWSYGKPPLILDLKATQADDDHIIALFKEKGLWGAISKTNHPVLRYRDPIYRDVRELVMSYFNEYFLNNRKKTLRSYSDPVDLGKFGKDWLISEKNQWEIVRALNIAKHYNVLKPGMARNLRLADKVELEATKKPEWPK